MLSLLSLAIIFIIACILIAVMTSKDGLTGRKSKFEDLLTGELTAAEILVLANGDIGLISQAMGFLAGAGKTSQVAALIAAGADVNMFDGFASHYTSCRLQGTPGSRPPASAQRRACHSSRSRGRR